MKNSSLRWGGLLCGHLTIPTRWAETRGAAILVGPAFPTVTAGSDKAGVGSGTELLDAGWEI